MPREREDARRMWKSISWSSDRPRMRATVLTLLMACGLAGLSGAFLGAFAMLRLAESSPPRIAFRLATVGAAIGFAGGALLAWKHWPRSSGK